MLGLAGCTKGEACEFRHSAAAKENPSVCQFWLNGNCGKLACPYRHPTIPRGPASVAPIPPHHMQGRGYPVHHAQVPGPCVFFMAGMCKKGANCPFQHPGVGDMGHGQGQRYGGPMDGAYAQGYEEGGEEEEEEEQQHQQQQQQVRQQRRGQKREVIVRQKEENGGVVKKKELTREERDALLSKPLSGAALSSKKGTKKEREEEPLVRAPVEPEKKRGKPEKPVVVEAKGKTPVRVKTLAEIMAEKDGSGAVVEAEKKKPIVVEGKKVVAAPASSTVVAKKNEAMNKPKTMEAELLELGIDLNDIPDGEDDASDADIEI